jgi:ABC-type multidrug transport system fused ATPase/permease subunit
VCCYSAADALDILLLILGTMGALANGEQQALQAGSFSTLPKQGSPSTIPFPTCAGAMLPLFSILFGDFANTFGSFIPPCYGVSLPGMKSTEQFMSEISSVALRFFYLSLGAAAAGCLQQGCWSYTSARQSNRLRSRFLQAVLKQDISFYDTQATTGQQ